MKTAQFLKHSIVIALLLLLTTGCSVHTSSNSGKIPPGQAKKISGSKSAKPYAPGQQKKRG